MAHREQHGNREAKKPKKEKPKGGVAVGSTKWAVSEIVEARTEIGPQVESALATLGTVLTGSGFDQMATIVDELNVAFAGRPQQVRELLDTLTALTGTATDNLSEFDAAIDLAQNISRQLVDQQAVLDGFLDTVPAATTVLARQRDVPTSGPSGSA